MNRIIGQNLSQTITEIEEKVTQFSLTPISTNGGWYDYSEPMTANLSIVLNGGYYLYYLSVDNTNVDLRNVFSVGDKIRLLQADSPDYKYFYCYGVHADKIAIDAGLDYTPTIGSAITLLSKGIMKNPTGFPGKFKFLSIIFGNTGTYSNPDPANNEQLYFSVKGNSVILNISIKNGAVDFDTFILLWPPLLGDTVAVSKGLSVVHNAALGWFETNFLGGLLVVIKLYGNNTTPPYNFLAGAGNTEVACTVIYKLLDPFTVS